MAIIKDKSNEEHLTEETVESVTEQDAKSYVGHMPDQEGEDVEGMLDQTGLYPDAEKSDEEVPEVNIAGEVRKAELARRGKLPEENLSDKEE